MGALEDSQDHPLYGEARGGQHGGGADVAREVAPKNTSHGIAGKAIALVHLVAVGAGMLLLVSSPLLVIGALSVLTHGDDWNSPFYVSDLSRGGVSLKISMLKRDLRGLETLSDSLMDFLVNDPWARDNLGETIRVEGGPAYRAGLAGTWNKAALTVIRSDGSTLRLDVDYGFDSSGRLYLTDALLYEPGKSEPVSSIRLNCTHKSVRGGIAVEYDIATAVAAHRERAEEALFNVLVSSEQLQEAFGEVVQARGFINERSFGRFCVRSSDAEYGQLWVSFDFTVDDDSCVIRDAVLGTMDGKRRMVFLRTSAQRELKIRLREVPQKASDSARVPGANPLSEGD